MTEKKALVPFMESKNIKAFIEGKNIEIRMKRKRISFAHLFEPQANYNDQTKELQSYSFSLNALVDKADEDDVKLLQACQKKAIELRWGENKPTIQTDRRCVRDGEPKDPDTEERIPLYDGYAGMIFVSANQRVSIGDWQDRKHNPVQLLDSRKGPNGKFPRLGKDSGKLYSGCVCDVIVRMYAYDGTKGGHPHRVNASLEAVKFVEHGPAFGAKPIDADSAFDEEDDDDLDGGATGGSDFSDDDDLLG